MPVGEVDRDEDGQRRAQGCQGVRMLRRCEDEFRLGIRDDPRHLLRMQFRIDGHSRQPGSPDAEQRRQKRTAVIHHDGDARSGWQMVPLQQTAGDAGDLVFESGEGEHAVVRRDGRLVGQVPRDRR